MAATVTYDGATVTLKEGQTVTFRFAEKVFKSDIVIRNNASYNWTTEPNEYGTTVKFANYRTEANAYGTTVILG